MVAGEYRDDGTISIRLVLKEKPCFELKIGDEYALAALDSLEETTKQSTGRLDLHNAFSSGWCAGYDAKHVEPDWIDEEFVEWLKHFKPQSEEPSEDAREFYFRLLSIAPDGDKSVDLITADRERIKRECADKADKALASEGYEDYENSIREFVRAAIMGGENDQEVHS
jgi:hypothetical protein